MANIPLKSIKFPDLPNTYVIEPEMSDVQGLEDALNNKANIDGYYDTLGAGTAEQLTSNIYEEDNTPYNFRTSGGSIDIGDRETDMLVGGTVAWNQKVLHGDFDSTTDWYKGVGVDSWSASSNVLTTTINGGSTLDPYKYGIYKNINGGLDTTHKYLSVYGIKPSVATTFRLELGGGVKKATATLSADVWSEVAFVDTPSTYNSQIYLYPYSAVVNVSAPEMTIQYRNAQLFDLTAMFGSTIADYIYSLEQANAGAGVAWFKKLFPKDYYEYNAGELMSVQAASHDMVGFNQWDEEWEVGDYNENTGEKYATTTTIRSKNRTRVVNGATYYFNVPYDVGSNGIRLFLYDLGGNFIRYGRIWSNSYTFGIDGYFTFALSSAYGSTYKNDICINLSWDGERDGEYEAYVKHSYPLDSSLTLRGIPKLDNGNLYYDGDTYESDGTVTRRFGVVDLGSLDWTYSSGKGGYFYTNLTQRKLATTVMCGKYPYVGVRPGGDYTDDKIIASEGNTNAYLDIRDTTYGTDATAFKTAMSGVYLVYELATPTTETADPYTNPQIVNDFGTEEYVDYPYSQGTRDVAIPVGHETQYMANLKAKLEMSPNSPEGAGDYIVRQTNGENEYVTLASNATIQNIIARLEALENA